MMAACVECARTYPEGELAPLYEDRRGSVTVYLRACRRCIVTYQKQGFISTDVPFWKRQQGTEEAA